MWPAFEFSRPFPRRLAAAACAGLLAWCAAAGGDARADRIILRNLKILSDVQVVSFDEDGVRLRTGQLIGWDEIERLTVTAAEQPRANQLLADLGIHLYRIRQRMKVGDYEGLLPHAEAVYPRYVDRRSDTAYMVKQALMWGLLAAGRREEAVAPYLGCLDLVRNAAGRSLDLPGQRRLVFDPQTGMTPDLQPVWFDEAAAKKALPDVLQVAGNMKKPLPLAARIYYASLALTAGETAAAQRVLDGVDQADLAAAQLTGLVRAQAEVLAGTPGPALSGLETSLESLSPENVPAARYWLGLAKLADDDERVRQTGILQLLRIPPLHGDRAPELAGAALYQAMQALAKQGDAKGSIAVRKELLEHFGHTYFAKQAKQSPDADEG